MHISIAEAGFDSMHVEQVQLPSMALSGLMAVAADQSKATTGEMSVDELASGFWLRVYVGKEASALEFT